MKAGNVSYDKPEELASQVPLFPLSGALLLPGGNMPLNIFEPRYLNMIDDALKGNRLIGMIQPALDAAEDTDHPPLCDIGCVGRVTAFQESGDNRLLINLSGICRFRLLAESTSTNGYRNGEIGIFANDLEDMARSEAEVDRDALLEAFRQFLEANELEADWEGVQEASTGILVNSLSMMSPYGPAEKQALLEAPDLKTRAETLIAITEISLAREAGGNNATLQ